MAINRVQRVSNPQGTVQADVEFRENLPVKLSLLVADEQRLNDLRLVLAKALNCWPEGPEWAFELSDVLGPPVAQKKKTQAT